MTVIMHVLPATLHVAQLLKRTDEMTQLPRFGFD